MGDAPTGSATSPTTDAGVSTAPDDPGTTPNPADDSEGDEDNLTDKQRELLDRARADGSMMVIATLAEGSRASRADRVEQGITENGGTIGRRSTRDAWVSATVGVEALWFLFGSGDVSQVSENEVSKPS